VMQDADTKQKLERMIEDRSWYDVARFAARFFSTEI